MSDVANASNAPTLEGIEPQCTHVEGHQEDAKPARRWMALKCAGVVACSLGWLAVWVLGRAQKQHSAADLRLIFPYLAASTVFFTTVVWVVVAGHESVEAATGHQGKRGFLSDRPFRVSLLAVVVIILFLVPTGLAAGDAANAVRDIDCYLFHRGDDGGACFRQPLDKWSSIVNWMAATANSCALGALLFIGLKGHELTLSARASVARPLQLSYCARSMSDLLLFASALLVTSTLALFLLFASADEIRGALAYKAPSAGPTVTAPGPGTLHIQCELPAAPASSPTRMTCISGLSVAQAQPRPVAPSMAFVAGLSFSAALFLLFITASAAIDDAFEAAFRHAVKNGEKSKKTWREANGFGEASASDRVLQALALFAPAITGALTLLTVH